MSRSKSSNLRPEGVRESKVFGKCQPFSDGTLESVFLRLLIPEISVKMFSFFLSEV